MSSHCNKFSSVAAQKHYKIGFDFRVCSSCLPYSEDKSTESLSINGLLESGTPSAIYLGLVTFKCGADCRLKRGSGTETLLSFE